MSEVDRIRDQFRRAFDGEAWHGPSVMALLNGVPAQLPDQEDWPPVNDFSEASWEKTKQDLRDTHEQLLQAIGALDDSRLDQPIIDHPEIKFSSMYVTL